MSFQTVPVDSTFGKMNNAARGLVAEGSELEIGLRRLDGELLERWNLRYAKNRFSHDISKPHEEPHKMYYPPPEDWVSRLTYGVLWATRAARRALGL